VPLYQVERQEISRKWLDEAQPIRLRRKSESQSSIAWTASQDPRSLRCPLCILEEGKLRIEPQIYETISSAFDIFLHGWSDWYQNPVIYIDASYSSGASTPATVQSETVATSSSTDTLESQFRELASMWRKETRAVSVLKRKVTHSAYQRIIGLGPPVIPLILRELEERPDDWLWALGALTGIDPAPDGASFDEAVDAWLDWGKKEHLL
jgi:hypothetical protein